MVTPDNDNPYDPPASNEPDDSTVQDGQDATGMAGRHAYNAVSDTVTGANLRLKDNVFQAIAIVVCLILGAAIGALVLQDHILGAVAGAFIGLLVGLFGSGIFLMIFRFVMHLRGRHD